MSDLLLLSHWQPHYKIGDLLRIEASEGGGVCVCSLSSDRINDVGRINRRGDEDEEGGRRMVMIMMMGGDVLM
jgi:hypothetical protein